MGSLTSLSRQMGVGNSCCWEFVPKWNTLSMRSTRHLTAHQKGRGTLWAQQIPQTLHYSTAVVLPIITWYHGSNQSLMLTSMVRREQYLAAIQRARPVRKGRALGLMRSWCSTLCSRAGMSRAGWACWACTSRMGSATAPTASKAASRKRHHSLSPEACQTASLLSVKPVSQGMCVSALQAVWLIFFNPCVLDVVLTAGKAAGTRHHLLSSEACHASQ